MNTLIYLLAALYIGSLVVQVLETDRNDPVRRAFAGLSSLMAATYLCFAAYLASGFEGMRYLYVLIGAFLPAASMTLLLRMMGSEDLVLGRRMWLLSGAVVGICLPALIVLLAISEVPLGIPFPELPVSLWTFGGTVFGFSWLLRRYSASPEGIQRTRLRYLIIIIATTLTVTGIEAGIRLYGRLLSEPGASSALQGAFPPVGAVLTTWVLHILHRIIELYRLIDLQETFSQALTLVIAATLLLTANGVAVYWVDGLSSQLHGNFQIFLITLAFLAVFGTIQERLQVLVGQWLNLQGRRLELTFQETERALAKIIELLGRLHASGRVPLTSLYLWDQGVFRLALERGVGERPLMRTIADQPFTNAFRDGQRSYNLRTLRREVRRPGDNREELSARIKAMEAMDADLSLSIMSGDLVLGWLNLKGDEWSDGFSHEEIRRLQGIVDRTAVVLENLRGFEQLKEQHRLAGLGTMAAGLAHEIRNPLAGIKGAAQYLQGDVTPEELDDFVSLIVEETDRLNGVVSQFLVYARPFEVRAEASDANELVERTMGLVRAEGHPAGVILTCHLAAGLPDVQMDRDRIQQVLLNLLHNALHAIDGKGTISVRTSVGRLRRQSGRGRPALTIQITDDGPGITPEDMEKLFIPFFTTRPQGTGLGLAISRRLVEAHGGEIDVRSQPGAGSTFTVRLPLAEEILAEPDVTEEQEKPRARLRLISRKG
jgi:nitrogen-specific signal transduction histidine kinase